MERSPSPSPDQPGSLGYSVAAKPQADERLRLAQLGHDLRTPLNAILGFSEILSRGPLTYDQTRSLQLLQHAGQYLLQMVNDLTDVQSPDGASQPILVPLGIGEVIESCLGIMGPEARRHQVRLLAHGLPAEPVVLGDRRRLTEILLNLLSNGIKYNRPGGSVTIEATEPGPGIVRILVRDTGVGIANLDQVRLFADYDRLGAEESSVPGSGLGLAIAQRLAIELASRIEVTSEAGSGSAFWIDLPRATLPVVPARPGVQLGHTTVLCIDDNHFNVALVERILAERSATRFLAAATGQEGIELCRSARPDIVLLDLNLPDIDGQTVLAALRSDSTTSACPVIVLSAEVDPEDIGTLVRSGVQAYLAKPFGVQELLDAIDSCLGEATRTAAER